MKRSIMGLVVLSLMLIGSCKRSNPNPNFWTFKGVTYNSYNGSTMSNIITDSSALQNSITSYGTIWLSFSSSTNITTAGTCQVYKYNKPLGNNAVTMYLTINGANPITYYATGGNGRNESVQVSVPLTGVVTVIGSGIEMVNANDPSDSSSLILNITM